MQRSVDRVAARYLTAKALNLAAYNLEGLVEGRPVTLYHGTTRLFRTFDMSKSRTDLVDDYYGSGIFLTPSKRVAEKYAEANRNIGFDLSIIDDLKQKNPKAGAFLRSLVEKGNDAWDELFDMLRKQGHQYPGDVADDYLGVDANSIGDISGYVLGSKVKALSTDDGPVLFNMSTGAPEWIYDTLEQVGLDSKVYRPKVYTVSVQVEKPLITANASQARKAKTNGYDCVVFYGSRLVDGVPEVAVFNPHQVAIRGIEVV